MRLHYVKITFSSVFVSVDVFLKEKEPIPGCACPFAASGRTSICHDCHQVWVGATTVEQHLAVPARGRSYLQGRNPLPCKLRITFVAS